MAGYTELFTKAVEHKDNYDFQAVKKRIDGCPDYHCGDWDEWADNNFDDEHLNMVLERLKTGHKGYVDSSCFTMKEIR